MQESLQEYCDARDARLHVDRDSSVIRGVKILGLRSRNGRVYLPAALSTAVPLYEGAKVNINHPKGHPHSPRDYQDRIGTLQNVAVRDGEGLFGDLHLNPAHALAEQLLWDAVHAPGNVGLSHNVQAHTARRGDEVVVEAILKVQGVDLVADPATSRGLFESIGVEEAAAPSESNADRPTTAAESDDPSTTGNCTLEEQANLLSQLRAERDELAATVARLQEQLAGLTRRELIRRVLAEQGLPAPDEGDSGAGGLIGESFLEELMTASDETQVRQMVLERARLIAAIRRGSPEVATRGRWSWPRSREQQGVRGGSAVNDVYEFVRAISG